MFWSLRSTAPLSLPRSPNPSWTTIQMSFAYVNCIHLSSFVHIQSILSRSLNLIKKSHLKAFHYDSTSTSTCAALIDGGSSDEAGSDSVACIGTSTECRSKINEQWKTVISTSSGNVSAYQPAWVKSNKSNTALHDFYIAHVITDLVPVIPGQTRQTPQCPGKSPKYHRNQNLWQCSLAAGAAIAAAGAAGTGGSGGLACTR